MSNRITASHVTSRLTLADRAPGALLRWQWWAGARHLWQLVTAPRAGFALSEHMRRDMGHPALVSQGAAIPDVETRRLGF